MQQIGRLERVGLRTVWPHEAYDFTTWLQSNIDVLNEVIGLTLENVEREQSAGNFSIDLVAEEASGAKVIIENQLGKSDHDHLGKLLTYLTAMNARVAVWIVAEPRPEHVAAIAWLNDSSSADFYLVKVEAVSIAGSPPAPLLTRIVGPSAETSEVSRSNREFAERHDLRMRWWSELVANPAANLHSHITPGVYSWIGVSMGVRGINLNMSVRRNDCQAEIYIDRGRGFDDQNFAIFDALHAQKDSIEASFGGTLLWQRLENSRACRVAATQTGGYLSPVEDWAEIQGRLLDTCNRLNSAFLPALRALTIN